MHVSLMFPTEFLCAADLQGKDRTVTIKSLQRESLRMNNGSTEDKWVLTFEKAKKRLVTNKTNAKLIAKALGQTETEKWIGQAITLYPTTCRLGADTVECIRVRTK